MKKMTDCASPFYTSNGFVSILSQKLIIREYTVWHTSFRTDEKSIIVPAEQSEKMFLVYMMKGCFQWIGTDRSIRVPQNIYHLAGFGRKSKYSIYLEEGNYECIMIEVPLYIYGEVLNFYNREEEIHKQCFCGYPFDNFFEIDEPVTKSLRKLIEGKGQLLTLARSFDELFREEYLLKLINYYLSAEERVFRQQSIFNQNLLKLEVIEDYIAKQLSETDSDYSLFGSIRNMLKLNNISEANFRAIIQHKYNCSWSQLVYNIRMKKARELLQATPHITLSEISDQLGYTSPSNFTRAFREYYKQSPSSLRRSVS